MLQNSSFIPFFYLYISYIQTSIYIVILFTTSESVVFFISSYLQKENIEKFKSFSIFCDYGYLFIHSRLERNMSSTTTTTTTRIYRKKLEKNIRKRKSFHTKVAINHRSSFPQTFFLLLLSESWWWVNEEFFLHCIRKICINSSYICIEIIKCGDKMLPLDWLLDVTCFPPWEMDGWLFSFH